MTYPRESNERKDRMTANAEDLAYLKDKYHQASSDSTRVSTKAAATSIWESSTTRSPVLRKSRFKKAQVPELRRLVSRAIRYQAECYLQQIKYDDVIARCDAWFNAARGDEANSPDWLAVRFQLAMAYLRQMEATENGPQRRRIRRKAREQFQIIARERNVFAEESREFLADLVARSGDTAVPEPKSFDEAYERAKDVLEQMAPPTPHSRSP